MPEEPTGTEARAKIQAEARRRLAELQEQEKAKNDELAKAMKDAEVKAKAEASSIPFSRIPFSGRQVGGKLIPRQGEEKDLCKQQTSRR